FGLIVIEAGCGGNEAGDVVSIIRHEHGAVRESMCEYAGGFGLVGGLFGGVANLAATEQAVDVIAVGFKGGGIGSAGVARLPRVHATRGSAHHSGGGRAEKCSAHHKGDAPREEPVSGIAKIHFVGVEIDPLGAEAPGEVTADTRRNNFGDAKIDEGAETYGGGRDAGAREGRQRRKSGAGTECEQYQ